MSSSSTARSWASRLVDALVGLEHLDDLAADLVDRVERRHRILEDHRDPLAANRTHLLATCGPTSSSPSTVAEPSMIVVLGNRPIRPRKRHRLARAGLADDTRPSRPGRRRDRPRARLGPCRSPLETRRESPAATIRNRSSSAPVDQLGIGGVSETVTDEVDGQSDQDQQARMGRPPSTRTRQ